MGQTLLKNSNEHNAPIANAVGQAEGLINIIYFLESRFQNSSPNPALPFFIVNASVLIPLVYCIKHFHENNVLLVFLNFYIFGLLNKKDYAILIAFSGSVPKNEIN